MTDNVGVIELMVDGMTCGHCVASVTEELEEIAGVKNVQVTLEKGGTSKVSVLADEPVSEEALRDAITEAGFQLVSIHQN